MLRLSAYSKRGGVNMFKEWLKNYKFVSEINLRIPRGRQVHLQIESKNK